MNLVFFYWITTSDPFFMPMLNELWLCGISNMLEFWKLSCKRCKRTASRCEHFVCADSTPLEWRKISRNWRIWISSGSLLLSHVCAASDEASNVRSWRISSDKWSKLSVCRASVCEYFHEANEDQFEELKNEAIFARSAKILKKKLQFLGKSIMSWTVTKLLALPPPPPKWCDVICGYF